MRRPRVVRDTQGEVLVERFAPIRRIEHLFVIVIFVGLSLTGFPQKFHGAGWAIWIMTALGGVDQVRAIHRVFGLIFAGHAALHIAALVVGTATRKMPLSLMPTVQDFRDAWNNLFYYLGRRSRPPRFPKFDYRQKFEYLGIVLGGLVMILSGLILMYPALAIGWLPGEVVPASRVAHSSEALLALSVLVIWHLYSSHLSPEIFPVDRTIFSGYIGLKELREHHTLEYERLFPDGVEPSSEPPEKAEDKTGKAE